MADCSSRQYVTSPSSSSVGSSAIANSVKAGPVRDTWPTKASATTEAVTDARNSVARPLLSLTVVERAVCSVKCSVVKAVRRCACAIDGSDVGGSTRLGLLMTMDRCRCGTRVTPPEVCDSAGRAVGIPFIGSSSIAVSTVRAGGVGTLSSACRRRRGGLWGGRSADAQAAAGRHRSAVSVRRQPCCAVSGGGGSPRAIAVVMRPGMQLLLLGPFEVVTDLGQRLLPGRGERALLALLALSAGQVVPTSALVDALWSSGDLPVDPGNALHVRVSKLRRALATIDAPDLVHLDGSGYRLDLDPASVDAHRFTALVEAARGTGDTQVAVGSYTRALSMWRGDPLVDFAGAAWTLVEAGRLAELRLAAISERADRMLTLGLFEQTVADLEPVVAAHPTRERLRRSRV